MNHLRSFRSNEDGAKPYHSCAVHVWHGFCFMIDFVVVRARSPNNGNHFVSTHPMRPARQWNCVPRPMSRLVSSWQLWRLGGRRAQSPSYKLYIFHHKQRRQMNASGVEKEETVAQIHRNSISRYFVLFHPVRVLLSLGSVGLWFFSSRNDDLVRYRAQLAFRSTRKRIDHVSFMARLPITMLMARVHAHRSSSSTDSPNLFLLCCIVWDTNVFQFVVLIRILAHRIGHISFKSFRARFVSTA